MILYLMKREYLNFVKFINFVVFWMGGKCNFVKWIIVIFDVVVY